MKFLHVILAALVTPANNPPHEIKPPVRTFPLLESIFNDDLITLENFLKTGHEQNRNFGVGTALDYAHLYGKQHALEILKRYGGKSGQELGIPTPAMSYNPSPRDQ